MSNHYCQQKIPNEMKMSSSADEDEQYLTKKVQTKVKKKWTKREMEGLLAAYERHKEDFITGVKLKIYGLIGEELEEAGILTSPVNAEMVHNKYKSMRKACRLSGEHAPYYHEIMEIFGPEDNHQSMETQSQITSMHIVPHEESNVKEELQDYDDMNSEDPLTAYIHNTTAPEATEEPHKEPKELSYLERRLAQREAMFREMEDNKKRRHAYSEKAKERRHKQKMQLLEKYLKGDHNE